MLTKGFLFTAFTPPTPLAVSLSHSLCVCDKRREIKKNWRNRWGNTGSMACTFKTQHAALEAHVMVNYLCASPMILGHDDRSCKQCYVIQHLWLRFLRISCTLFSSLIGMTFLVFSLLLLLPLVSAQTYRWGPCPSPRVQPNFDLNQVIHTRQYIHSLSLSLSFSSSQTHSLQGCLTHSCTPSVLSTWERGMRLRNSQHRLREESAFRPTMLWGRMAPSEWSTAGFSE